MTKHSTHDLIGVPETMMIPLYARATETRRGGIIQDTHAVDMIDKIDYDFSRFKESEASVLGVAVRTEILDDYTRDFITRHPDGTIVNIAAGLDTRFYRVDNGHIQWYDLDLPESMAMRKKFITFGRRHYALAGSALDTDWMQSIEPDRGLLFIIEGLLMYFTEDEAKRLFINLATHFPGAEAIAEVIGRSQAQNTEKNDSVSKTDATFKWGIRNAAEIADWHPAITFKSDVSIYERHPARWLALDIDWPAPLEALRNTTHRIVHLGF